MSSLTSESSAGTVSAKTVSAKTVSAKTVSAKTVSAKTVSAKTVSAREVSALEVTLLSVDPGLAAAQSPQEDCSASDGALNTPSEVPVRSQGRKEKSAKARVRTYSATDRDMEMLAAISDYHGFSRSAMLASLIRKEFWRCFPAGTPELRPDEGARTEAGGSGGRSARS